MFDFQDGQIDFADPLWLRDDDIVASRQDDWPKIIFDGVVAFALLPVLALVAVALTFLNPILNPGPLLFRQTRMGYGCAPFTALKFRTMALADPSPRGAFDALEEDRIPPFARILRKMRVDELPQIINVLRGEMSMIGPRPDLYDHACVYADTVAGYTARHAAMPGITGYAQVAVGYVDGRVALDQKVAADHYYLRHASFRFDLWIAWRTIWVILRREGC